VHHPWNRMEAPAVRIPERGRQVRTLIALWLVAVLGGCALAPGAEGGTTPPAVTGDLARERQQAHDALDRWAAAVAAAGGQQGFSVSGSRTGQIGDWELAVGSNNKAALYAGLVEAAVALPTEIPPPGEVRWDDGSTLRVPLVSAAQALQEIQADKADCGGCTDLTPLKVTAARLATGQVSTSRGPATVPTWEFSVEGTAVKITRVAVAPATTVTVSPPPWDSTNPPIGLSIDSATGSATSRELTVTFTGAPKPASELCGADYTTEAVESSLAVVVIVIVHPNPAHVACTLVGAIRAATVQLAAPLGDRAVLEGKEGLPVPVTLH
jgi:hypothetical protein